MVLVLSGSMNMALTLTVAVLGAGDIQAAPDTAAVTLQPGQRQLFLDDFVIAEISGLVRTLHRAEKRGPVVRPDIPTDGTLIQTRGEPVWSPEDDEYKLVYYAYGGGALGTGMALATSKDGLHWTKPLLGLVEVQGNTTNNWIAIDPSIGPPNRAIDGVVYDPDDKDPNRRYKTLLGAINRRPAVSADCVHWTRIGTTEIPSSDESHFLYDRDRRQFHAIVKTSNVYGRAFAIASSSDFEHWTPNRPLFGADADDQKMAPDTVTAPIDMICKTPSGIGCAATPVPAISQAIEQSELSAHVSYLASPKLHGRKPLSRGSRLARRYIESQFQACGLRPWSDEPGYEQSVYIGTNVVGVLPGSDPSLKDQYILVNAHYDHLGGGNRGAADNASGVAALLEMAERLSSSPARRPVVFACFDREETMLFGAYAFTCRADFDRKKIVAMVNMDMFGREFLDRLPNVLFAIGTEQFPQLHQTVLDAGRSNGIEVLPVAGDIVGPRSDHMAFMDAPSPCLFFSCGVFPDHHSPRDTPDRLDYGLMCKSANTVYDTLRALADASSIEAPNADDAPDRTELATFRRILPLIFAGADEEKPPSDAEKSTRAAVLARLEATATAPAYTQSDRQSLISEALPSLAPVLAPILTGDTQAASHAESNTSSGEDLAMLTRASLALSAFPDECSKAYRTCVAAILKRRPLPLIRPLRDFQYEHSALRDGDFRLQPIADGRFRLSALPTYVSLHMYMTWFRPHGNLNFVFLPIDFCGTRDETISHCLLTWPTTASHNHDYDEAFCGLLQRVAGEQAGKSREEWVQWNLNRLKHRDATAWLLDLIQNPNVELAAQALRYSEAYLKGPDIEFESRACGILNDRSSDPRLRAAAIQACGRASASKLALVNVLSEDEPPVRRNDSDLATVQDKTYPFYTDYRAAFIRPVLEKREDNPASLADLAAARLKALTSKDFGKDQAAWGAWIGRNATEMAGGTPF